MIINGNINAQCDNRKEKCVLSGNEKKKVVRNIIRAISSLTRLETPLMLWRLPGQSLSFANIMLLTILVDSFFNLI